MFYKDRLFQRSRSRLGFVLISSVSMLLLCCAESVAATRLVIGYSTIRRTAQRTAIHRDQNPRIGDVKVEELIDNRSVRKLDETGFIDRLFSGATGH